MSHEAYELCLVNTTPNWPYLAVPVSLLTWGGRSSGNAPPHTQKSVATGLKGESTCPLDRSPNALRMPWGAWCECLPHFAAILTSMCAIQLTFSETSSTGHLLHDSGEMELWIPLSGTQLDAHCQASIEFPALRLVKAHCRCALARHRKALHFSCTSCKNPKCIH